MRFPIPAARSVPGLVLLASAACLAATGTAQQPRFEVLSRAGFDPVSENSVSATVFDANGDGALDLYVGNDRVPDRLYLGSGSGTFTEAPAGSLPPLPTGVTRGVAAGDLDFDGDTDLLLARDFPSWQNRLLLNDGTGRFVDASARLPQGNDQSRSVDLGDVDGDGDLDAVVANFNQVDVLLLNDGGARFSVVGPPRYPTAILPSEVTRWIDVDGDGDLDAVTGLNKAGSSVRDRLYLNDGTGSFVDVSSATLPALGVRTTAIASADFDADGDLDLFLTQGVGNDLLLLNDGTNAFVVAPPGTFPPGDTISFGAVAADFDGDQDIDLAVGSNGFTGGGFDRIYLNDGSGRMTEHAGMPPGRLRTRNLISADFDGNGTPDLFAIHERARNGLLLNDGQAQFEDSLQQRLPSSYQGGRRIVTADIDQDGDEDCLVVNGIGDRDQLFLNDGSGFFEDATSRLPTVAPRNTAWFACGDMDRDGDLDLFVARSDQNRLWRNDGPAGFVDLTATHLPRAATRTSHAAWLDADGDGDLDLVTADDQAQNTLLLNDGSGRLADATFGRMPPESHESYFVAPVDIDADGDQDLLVVHRYFNSVYVNDGVGFFFDGSPRLFPPQTYLRTLNLAHGDVDGDGDVDVMLGDRFQPDRLYLNDGTGLFTDATASHVLATNDRQDEVYFADLDGDGDLDAVRGGGQNWLNDGSGVFTDAPASEYPELAGSSAIADLDRDGDPDIASLNGVHVNLRRQLALEVPTRLRGALRVRAYARRGSGQASSVFLPLLGVRRLPSPARIPGLGLLHLDLGGTTVALGPISVTQPPGDGGLSLPIPADPNLVGVELFLQAVEAGAAPRLSNLVVDRIRG